MLTAIVDLGTNTFNLLIAEVKGKDFEVVYSGREVVKLGEKSINDHTISEAAFARGVKAFKNLSSIISKYNPGIIKALATSAIREAHNGNDFVNALITQTGIDVEVISGDKEAELVCYGNRLAVELGEEPHLIMDIGGGSTEFIIANNKEIFWKQSYKLGVARLLEKFRPEDPVTNSTIGKVNDYLREELDSLLRAVKKNRPAIFLGSAGAFETVVDMIGKEKADRAKSFYIIDQADYFAVSKKTIASTSAEREKMAGLIPMRRDMIVLSYLLIDFVLNNLETKKLKVSMYSLKEGALCEIINTNIC